MFLIIVRVLSAVVSELPIEFIVDSIASEKFSKFGINILEHKENLHTYIHT